MSRLTSVCARLLRQLFGCLLCFVVWSLWTLLIAALGIQAWIAVRHEIVLPGPLLRIVERHLSTPSYRVTLGHAAFDPSGNLVIQGLEIELPGFEGPVLRAGQIQTRLDPWGLFVGHPNAHRLAVTGAEILYPSQLSPTGRPEAIVHNLDAVLRFEGNRVEIDALSGMAGPVALSAHGAIALAPLRGPPSATSAGFDAARAVGATISFLRKAANITPKLDALKGARLDLRLFPSPVAGALVDADFSASRLEIVTPHPVETGPFHLTTRFPLAGRVSARVIARLRLGSLSTAEGSTGGVTARLVATWSPHAHTFVPLRADLSAVGIRFMDTDVDALELSARPAPLPAIAFEAQASVADARLAAQGTIIPSLRSGSFTFDAVAGNGLEALVSKRIHRDLGRFVTFSRPGHASGSVRLLPGGKLASAQAWVDVHHLVAHEVPLDRISGHVWFDGHTFLADHAVVLQGDNVARGSYEMDVKTHDFRFLLSGFLRPPDIEGWFKPWWPALWKNFAFPTAAPAANIDIQGRWRFPALTTVFVGVDARNPVVREVPFDEVHTRVYSHGHDVDALSVNALRKEGSVRGWFTRTFDMDKSEWQSIDFDMTTSVDLAECARIIHKVGPEILAPFRFEHPPEVHAKGHIDGPAAPGGPNENVSFDVHSSGGFAFRGFPLRDVSFAGSMKNRRVDLHELKAGFAGGKAEAKLSVVPEGSLRKVEVQASLSGAKLGKIIESVEAYAAITRKNSVLPKASKEERASNASLDANVRAEGILGDPYSYHGTGTAQLSGSELGHVRLFGDLSELLKFTSLRFTTAKTTFKLAGPMIDFQSVRVTGHNSAIDAHGTYSLKTKTLDFKAQVWPFEQSDGLVRGAVGLVLSPLTVFLEVKLGGTLAKPSWSFLYSPFRMLNEPDASDVTPHAPAPPTKAPMDTPKAP